MRAFITKHLTYPEEALKDRIEGTVHIRYGIDHTGKVIDIKIIKGLGGGCSEEAIRLVGMLKFNLERTRGVKVLFHKKIQIHFRLPSQQQTVSPPSIGYTITPTAPKTAPAGAPKKSYTITITYSA